MPTFFSCSEKETREFGVKFAENLIKNNKKTHIILLIGDLGSGKTAFVRGFAKAFNIKRVLSPTFNIMKKYKINRNKYFYLLHADLYRVKNKRELTNLEFYRELQKEGTISLIEWPERVGKQITGIKIRFSYGKQANERLIHYN